MATNINTILDWFRTGKKPTQSQFWASWQSFWHKDEIIPVGTIENLTEILDAKANDSTTMSLRGELGTNIDLNTLTTTGFYIQNLNVNAASGSNYPEPIAGKLDVMAHSPTILYQTYHSYQSANRIWYRACYNNIWSTWKVVSEVQNSLTPSTIAAPSVTAVNTALALKANDADVVHIANNETIVGTKTFTSEVTIPDGTVPTSAVNKGQIDLKADLINGKIPASQLPNSSTSVFEFDSFEDFPASGISGKIYIAKDTNFMYIWSDSGYVTTGSSLSLGEIATTAYRGDRGKTAYDHSQATGNPHNTQVADISGLSAALAGKQATLTSGTNIKSVNGTSLLGNGDLVVVQNSLTASTTTAPSATAVNTALSLKANDANVVHTSNSETIGGIKTFTSEVIVPSGTAATSAVNKGQIDLKADLVAGKIPASQLPSYVDDVLEFANLSSFPATGETGKLYIAIDTNLIYRWSGSTYVVTSSSLALGETAATAYRGDRGKIAYDHSQATGNPHNTQVADISGLSTALAGKQATLVSGTNIKTVGGQSLVGSGNITEVQDNLTASTSVAPSVNTVNTALALKANDSSSMSRRAELGGSIDLNTVTNIGFYIQNLNANAASGSNYPEAIAGKLEVMTHTTANVIYQTYHTYQASNRIWYRACYNGTWSTWKLLSDDATVVHLAGAETISGSKTFNNNLNVNSTGTNNLGINMYASGSNGFMLITFNDSRTGANGWNIEVGRQLGTLSFYSNSGQQVSFLQNGNMGLGITTPAYKLDVNGTVRIIGQLTIPDGTATTSAVTLAQLNTKANDNAVVHLTGTEIIGGAKTFSNLITYSNTLFDTIINEYVTIKNKILSGGWARGFKLTDNANVNHVEFGAYGTAQALNYAYIGLGTNPSVDAKIKLNNTGVGIGLSGTSVPTTALEVNGTLLIKDAPSGNTLKLQRGTFGAIIANSSLEDGYITYNLAGTTAYQRIFGNGNTIIGSTITSDTNYKLNVQGTAKIDGQLTIPEGTATTSAVTLNQLNGKQATLTSGTNIKTIGGQSLLGSGNLTEVQNSLTASTVLAPSVTAVNTALIQKVSYEDFATKITNYFTSSPTLNFPSIPAGSYADLTLNTSLGTPVGVGQHVVVSVPLNCIIPLVEYKAWVSAPSIITIRATNYSTSAIDPVAGYFPITVFF